ncbi:MAG: MFS transporter [Christensenellaceae bacterium]|jgi:Na+/melibiose symporter-like transporter|nr:MFS transporter [Christensenellaceae bacterium]
MKVTLKERLLGLKGNEVIAFSLLVFGQTMLGSAVSTGVNILFTDVWHLTAWTTAFIMLGAKIAEALANPFSGYLVDRTNTKWGKCRPYILFATVPLVAATILMFLPVNLGTNGDIIFLTATFMIYTVANVFFYLPMSGLMPLAFPDTVKRTKAISYSSTLGSMGSILPSLLFFLIADLVARGSGNDKLGYFISAIAFTLPSALLIFLTFNKIKEKVVIPNKKEKYLESIKFVVKNKPLLLVVISSIMLPLANLTGGFIGYFSKWAYVDTINFGGVGNLAILFPALSILSGFAYMLSMALVPFFLKYMSKKTLFIASSLFGIVANVAAYFIGYENIFLFAAFRFFTNFPVGIAAVLMSSFTTENVEYTQWKTGKRAEGAIFAMKNMIVSVFSAVTIVLPIMILGILNYRPEAMQAIVDAKQPLMQSEYGSFIHDIFFCMTILSAFGYVLQLVPMLFYKFNDKEYAVALAEIKARDEESAFL